MADRFIPGAAPIDYGPVLLRKPFGFHLAVDTLPSPVAATGASEALPPLWIWRSPSERQEDFNLPEHAAARRTLWPRLTSRTAQSASPFQA